MALCGVVLAFSHNASGSSMNLGIPSGAGAGALYVSHLTGMANGDIHLRSNNTFGSLPTAGLNYNGTDATMNLGAGREIITVPSPRGKPVGVGVPDGGATVMLLGAALTVLGIARRSLMN